MLSLTTATQQGSVTLTVTGLEAVEGFAQVDYSIKNNIVSFTFSNLTENINTVITINGTDSANNTDSVNVGFVVENTTIKPKIAAFNRLKESVETDLMLPQEMKTLAVHGKLARISNRLTHLDLKEMLLIAQPRIDNNSALAIIEALSVEAPTNEQELDTLLANVITLYGEHAHNANAMLTSIQENLDGIITPISVGQFFLTADGQLSQFYGNPNMGTGEQFEFDENFSYFNEIVSLQ